jgi:hypothetical protein
MGKDFLSDHRLSQWKKPAAPLSDLACDESGFNLTRIFCHALTALISSARKGFVVDNPFLSRTTRP